MSQKIVMGYSSGKTCWAMSFHPDGRVLDVVAKEWTDFVLGDLADYVMTYEELTSTGIYTAEYPDDFELDVLPTEVSYQQAGPAAALPDDLPVISIGQSQGSNMAAINYEVLATQNMAESAKTIEMGIVQSGSNTVSQIVTDLSGATDNLYRGRVVIFTSGGMNKAAAIITGYNATTKVMTFTEIPSAPSVGNTFLVV